MRFLLLCAALLAAAPAPAQARGEPRPLTSGSRVTLYLHEGHGGGIPGIVVGASGDTLHIISPEIGLAQVPAGAVARLEAPGAARGELLKYAFVIVGVSAGAGLGAVAGDEEFVPVFINALIVSSAVGGVMYAREGPPRAPAPVDVSRGIPGGAVLPGRGAPVRFSTADRPMARARLTGFSADSLFLRGGDAPPSVSRAEVTRLQVSLRADRARGDRIGGRVGAVGGGLLLGGAMALQGGWGLALSPLGASLGAVFGGTVGSFTGYVFAPPSWSDVSITRPR
ncbi:MAG TPA: hypothetical protein VF665_24735 [Longimicrobium sp.]|uniref:hypothetical protein n=1 Tax=Longimicrobium sp. TaxID=2029185 RepID=UPI002EDA7C8E